MKVLLHICCGPCAIMPIQRLLEEGHELTGYFYNPNIHPLSEYLRRREGAEQMAAKAGIPMLWATDQEHYNTTNWLHMVHGREGERCQLCFGQRLEETCRLALEGGFAAFSSSLLYSRYQPHEAIARRGAELAAAAGNSLHKGGGSDNGLLFLYRDFRTDWQAGIERSRAWGIYRQQYCGCIFSENERYAKALQNSNAALDK